jgi:signal transduction histidine kinase
MKSSIFALQIMNSYRRCHVILLLTTLLLMMPCGYIFADVGLDDLKGEDREMFDRFHNLFQNGTPDDFFAFTAVYEQNLKEKGYMMLYYKLKNNKGFYALRHNMLYRAMQIAEQLDIELRNDGASQYYYLATGLMADVYKASHNRLKAEQYFIQALEEVDDRDPKFTMRSYQSLAEIQGLAEPEKALEWINKSLALAEETDNTEYHSLTLAMGAYIQFLNNSQEGFYRFYNQYVKLREQNLVDFNHRYDNILEVARLSFEGDYDKATYQLGHSGTVYVDSSLMAIRVFAMERNIDKSYAALSRRFFEMDSIYSLSQDANFDEMATERSLMRSREEANANKKLVRRLIGWLIGLTIVYVIVYVMGRRRLVRKIWARNKELKDALERVEKSDRVKMAFINNMSHEIRTPLNAVAGFSQLLCNPDFQVTDEEKANMQKRITSSVDQITGIVNEVLELSTGESDGIVTEGEKTDVMINDLCRGVLLDAKGRQSTGVEIRFSTNVDDSHVVRSNAYRLSIVLRHLVDNAIKFTEKGYILTDVNCSTHQMIISVSDTGIGVAEEDRDRIFEVFSKGDDFKEGLGLGLPICVRMVQSLGGTLELDPEYTAGSRFVVTLPI